MTLFSCFKVNVNVNSPFECRICKKSHKFQNVVKLISAVSLIKFMRRKNTKESQNNTSTLGFSKMMISIMIKLS